MKSKNLLIKCVSMLLVVTMVFTVSCKPSGGKDDGDYGVPYVKLSSIADTVDVAILGNGGDDINQTVLSLMAIVNREKPRLGIAPEGSAKEFDNLGITYNKLSIQEVFNKYKEYMTKLILYRANEKIGGKEYYDHTSNLAETHAGLEDAIVATPEVNQQLKQWGLDITILKDYSTQFSSPTGDADGADEKEKHVESIHRLEVYNYMYDNLWNHPKMNKRLVFSRPVYIKEKLADYSMLARGALTFLGNDSRNYPNERKLLDKFLNDTKAGASAYMGWGFDDEGPFITAASEHGMYGIPSDFSANLSLYQAARMGEIPKLANTDITQYLDSQGKVKPFVYVAMGVSDGDNFQYLGGHLLINLWQEYLNRSDLPAISWSFSPALVEMGPVLNDYFYKSIKSADTFYTGPSGVGYFYPGKMYANKDLHDALNHIYDTTNDLMGKNGMQVISNWYQGVTDPTIPNEFKKLVAPHLSNVKGILSQRNIAKPELENNVLFGGWDDPYSGDVNFWSGKVSGAFLDYVFDRGEQAKFVNIQTVNWTDQLLNKIKSVKDNAFGLSDKDDLLVEHNGAEVVKFININEWVALRAKTL